MFAENSKTSVAQTHEGDDLGTLIPVLGYILASCHRLIQGI